MTDKKGFDRRDFLAGVGAVMAGSPLPRRPAAAGSCPWVGQVPAGADGKLKILAFTDLHFGQLGRKIDEWSARDMKKMNGHFQPDVIFVTGDAWFENPAGKGVDFCRYFCDVMAGLGRPWAYVRGNHDKADDFAVCDEMIASTPGSLYLGSGTKGNYRLAVTDGGRTLYY